MICFTKLLVKLALSEVVAMFILWCDRWVIRQRQHDIYSLGALILYVHGIIIMIVQDVQKLFFFTFKLINVFSIWQDKFIWNMLTKCLQLFNNNNLFWPILLTRPPGSQHEIYSLWARRCCLFGSHTTGK